MSLRRVLVGVAAVVALGSAGCSASGTDGGGDVKAAAPAAAAADDSGDGKDVCAHLKKELPRIKAVGSEVGAMAQLAMSLAGFYENHEKLADGEALDAQTEKACPEVRAEILEAAGIKSFADL
jgi:hypothetical protein